MTLRYHWVIGTTDDHCSLQVPLFGMTVDGRWANEIVGWACEHCWEQTFDRPIADSSYTPSGW